MLVNKQLFLSSRKCTRQYMSIIFYQDEEQKRQAEESKLAEEKKRKGTIRTEIWPMDKFYEAEG